MKLLPLIIVLAYALTVAWLILGQNAPKTPQVPPHADPIIEIWTERGPVTVSGHYPRVMRKL
jgi:hypothetical protein